MFLRIFSLVFLFFTVPLSSAIAAVPDPRYVVPTQSLIIFLCFLGFYLWRQLLLRTEPRQASYGTR